MIGQYLTTSKPDGNTNKTVIPTNWSKSGAGVKTSVSNASYQRFQTLLEAKQFSRIVQSRDPSNDKPGAKPAMAMVIDKTRVDEFKIVCGC
jgi:hypothetical protein